MSPCPLPERPAASASPGTVCLTDHALHDGMARKSSPGAFHECKEIRLNVTRSVKRDPL